jgi:hypothetical protein
VAVRLRLLVAVAWPAMSGFTFSGFITPMVTGKLPSNLFRAAQEVPNGARRAALRRRDRRRRGSVDRPLI